MIRATGRSPSLCLISESTVPSNAIGRIACAQVRAALGQGWRVSVVAKHLDESLRDEVEWLRLYVPKRGFALQWLTGRNFIRRALGRHQFDLVHGHQPQIADVCDVYQCHFLTRVAHERKCLVDHHGARRLLDAVQKRVVLHAEDFFYRRWNPKTQMLFNSAMTRSEFIRLYGRPPLERVLICPSPQWQPANEAERSAARHRFFGSARDGIVAGFLGGLHERKGYRRVVAALTGHADITLLMGGLYSEGFEPPGIKAHFHSVGLCRDVSSFYAACDVLLVASHFEPFGYVVSEALARGTPVIVTPEVGAAPHVLEHGAGLCWSGTDSLAERIRWIAGRRSELTDACERFTRAYGLENHDRQLMAVYDQMLARKSA